MVAIERASEIRSPPDARSWTGRLIASVRADAWFHAVVAVYLAAAYVAAEASGRDYLTPIVRQYVEAWSALAFSLCAFMFAARLAAKLVTERPLRARTAVSETLAHLLSPEVATGLLLTLTLAAFMGAFTTFKTLIPLIDPFWADPVFANLDRQLLGGHDAWRLLQPWLGHPALTRMIEVVYQPVWSATVVFTTAYFCLFARDLRLRRRFVAAFLTVWIVSGSVLACMFASGGPAFYAQLTGDGSRFAELLRYLNLGRSSPISAAAEQQALWSIYAAHKPWIAAGISAVPSMHVTMAVLCALAVGRLHRLLALATWILVGVIFLGSIQLGWHYASGDMLAFVTTVTVWWAAGRISGRDGATKRSPALV